MKLTKTLKLAIKKMQLQKIISPNCIDGRGLLGKSQPICRFGSELPLIILQHIGFEAY
jgi:hypothetical protein